MIRRRPRTAAFAFVAAAVAAMAASGGFPAPVVSGEGEVHQGLAAVAVIPASRAWPWVRRRLDRLARRVAGDVHLSLALGLVTPVLAVDWLFKPAGLPDALLVSLAFLAVQALPTLLRRGMAKTTGRNQVVAA